MDGLEGAVAQAVSESVAIARSGSARFEQSEVDALPISLGSPHCRCSPSPSSSHIHVKS
jgi:hypothetical protein